MAFSNGKDINGTPAGINSKSDKSSQATGFQQISMEEFLQLLETPMDSTEITDTAMKLIDCIKKILNKEQPKWCEVKGAIVTAYNKDSNVATIRFPNSDNTWSGIINQSIYQNLNVGQPVKVLIQHQGESSDHWIIGSHGILPNSFDELKKENEQLKQEIDGLREEMYDLIASLNNSTIS